MQTNDHFYMSESSDGISVISESDLGANDGGNATEKENLELTAILSTTKNEPEDSSIADEDDYVEHSISKSSKFLFLAVLSILVIAILLSRTIYLETENQQLRLGLKKHSLDCPEICVNNEIETDKEIDDFINRHIESLNNEIEKIIRRRATVTAESL